MAEKKKSKLLFLVGFVTGLVLVFIPEPITTGTGLVIIVGSLAYMGIK